MAHSGQYTSIMPGKTGESYFEDRKSQFFGFACHATSADEAIEFRHAIMARIPEASHYVSAWVIHEGGVEFFSDAKEPHGAAGMPVLNTIKGRGLSDSACVVARVFGGTLLGKGGLMRAYAKAAADALDAAPKAVATPCDLLNVAIPYALYGSLKAALPKWNAILDSEDFAELVVLRLAMPSTETSRLEAQIVDFTNATAVVTRAGEQLRYLPAR